MPTYHFRCGECHRDQDVFLRVSEKGAKDPSCCGQTMQTVLHAPLVVKVQGECHYRCPVTGEGITSWRQRRNVMAEHQLMDANEVYGTTDAEAIVEKHRQKHIKEIVEPAKAFDALPPGVKPEEVLPALPA